MKVLTVVRKNHQNRIYIDNLYVNYMKHICTGIG